MIAPHSNQNSSIDNLPYRTTFDIPKPSSKGDSGKRSHPSNWTYWHLWYQYLNGEAPSFHRNHQVWSLCYNAGAWWWWTLDGVCVWEREYSLFVIKKKCNILLSIIRPLFQDSWSFSIVCFLWPNLKWHGVYRFQHHTWTLEELKMSMLDWTSSSSRPALINYVLIQFP